jgi:hypothetical protein
MPFIIAVCGCFTNCADADGNNPKAKAGAVYLETAWMASARYWTFLEVTPAILILPSPVM